MLRNIAGEGNGLVKVEGKAAFAFVVFVLVQTVDHIDFLIHFTLGAQDFDFLDGRRFDGAKSVRLKHPADMIHPVQLNAAHFGQPFGKSGYRAGFVDFLFSHHDTV